jgi:uroporphyrinogen-III synthase
MLRIMLTRPRGQSDFLAAKLRESGCFPVIFPTIEIIDSPDKKKLQQVTHNLAGYDIIIFISPAAFEHMLPWLQALPTKTQLMTIGKDTATLIQRSGFAQALYPKDNFNRDALLALPELQNVKNKTILLCQGDGGNPLIAETLRKRGATVYVAIAYQRRLPSPDQLPRLDAIDIIQVSSEESLRNLLQILGPEVLAKKLLLSSGKLCELAKSLGFTMQPLLAKNAGDEAILHTLVDLIG